MKKSLLFLFIFLNASLADAQYWIQTGGSSTIDEGMDVVADGFGNTYTTGYFTSALSMDGHNLLSSGVTDIFIVRTNSAGTISWLKSAGGTNIDKALSIDADASGNIALTGLFYGSADFDGQIITSSGQQDMFIAKYDSSGTLLWVRKAGGMAGDAGNGVAFDHSGNVIVTGEFSDTCAFGTTVLTSLDESIDAFIAKYSINGNLLWVKKGSGYYTDRGTDIATDTYGNIYVTGMFSDTITFDNVHNNAMHNAIFLIKYNSAGTEKWFRWMGSGSVAGVGGIAIHNNRINITGNFSGSLYLFGNAGNPVLSGMHPENIFVIRYGLSGNLIWKRADGSDNDVTSQSITTNENGEVLIAGNFKCRFSDYSAHYGTGIFCSIGFWDNYIASYDNSGNWQWARQFGGRQNDFVNGITISSDSLISSTGSFEEKFMAPINYASFIMHGFYEFHSTGFNGYCSDNSYGEYIIYPSNGNSDIFINSNVDLSRQPFDYFERSGAACIRTFNESCIVLQSAPACIDSIFKCGDDSLEINLYTEDSISPVFSYLWNTLSTDDIIPVSVSNYYSINVTSLDGCFSNSDSVYFLSYPEPPVPLISDSKGININALNTSSIQLCQPDSVQLSCTNVGTYSVQWSGFPTGQNPVWVNSDGTYSVTLTNSYGCAESNSIIIFSDSIMNFPFVIPKLICEADTIDKNDSIAVCAGELFYLFVYDSITSPLGTNNGFPGLYSAEWNVTPPGILNYSTSTLLDNRNMFVAFIAGEFDLLFSIDVVRGNVCSFDTVHVEKTIHVSVHPTPSGSINVSIIGPADICPGISAMLVAQPDSVSFLWSTSETNDTIYVSQPGTYIVSAFEDVVNSFGCVGTYTGSAAHSLTSYTQPFVYIPSGGVICPGDSLELICTGTGAFNWQGPNGYAGNQWSIFVTIPGFYYCIETVGPGCDLVSNTIEVLQYSTPFLNAFPDLIVCPGDSIMLIVNAGPGSIIQWQPPLSGSTSVQVVYNPGAYFCDVTSCGIITTLSYTLVQYPAPPTPVISWQPPNLISTPATGYQWYFNNVPINGATSQTYDPSQNGSYTVEITDSNGCTALSLPYLWSNVGIYELYENDLIIIPNPVKSSLQIIFTSDNFMEGKTIIRLKNILGEELLKIQAHKTETISLNNFSDGMYFIEVVSESKVLKRKIIVNH